MHEIWLQKYIKEHHQLIGFSQIHGPYSFGADFKGVYGEKPVKIEAEWDYADYISHKHSLRFADVLVVATLKPVPESLRALLPSIIINLNPELVAAWAKPLIVKESEDGYHAYAWRRFSRHLLYLYAFYQKQNKRKTDYPGSDLIYSMSWSQKPGGFKFSEGGKEEGFEGLKEDKASWDFWLEMAHRVAAHFRLKPALLRPTWIERVAIYVNNTGRMTESEAARFKAVADYIDTLLV